MSESQGKLRKPKLLLEPTYGYGECPPRKPSVREVFAEWIDAMAFWKDGARALPAAYAVYHLATFAVFVVMLVWHFSIANVVITILLASAIATVYNTVWYHRYCSHRAFKFRSIWLA